MNTNPKSPAFPIVADFGSDDRQFNEGLNTREYFAIKIAQGMYANPEVFMNWNQKDIPSAAVEAADKLIEELNKALSSTQ